MTAALPTALVDAACRGGGADGLPGRPADWRRAMDALEIEQFLHTERLPHIWCPGCGIGIVTGAFLRAVLDLGLVREKTVVVGGIGCSSRAVGYIDLGTVHSIHGRALAFATGIKMARPDFTVVVLTGDGDGAAIGGNHLIHACRRNIDITCILFNNQTYGMTGGQVSPTMEPGDRGTTAPYGSRSSRRSTSAGWPKRRGRASWPEVRRPTSGRSSGSSSRGSSTRASRSSRPWCPAPPSTASGTRRRA